MTVEKTCTRCRLTKPASEFSKDSRGKDGLQGWCKDCGHKHYAANGVARREQRRQHRESHRDEIAEGDRRYRADNKDVLKERAIRRYGEGGRPADLPWPDRPIAYVTAHSRVKAIYGAASKHPCIACGEQAHAWAYDHTDPNPLIRKDAAGRWAGIPIPYSTDPQRYDPMCRSCHVKRDRWAA